MTSLPTTGRISCKNIATVFNIHGRVSSKALLRGSSVIPNIAANNSVPLSGSIKFSQLRGASVYVVTAPSSEKPFSTPIPNINLQTKKPMFASTVVGVNDVRYTLMSSFAINNNFLDEDESNYTSSDGMYGRDTQPLRGQPFDQWYMIKYNNATYGTDVPYISYVTSNESYTELGTMAMPTSAGIISSGVTLYGDL